MLGKCFFWLCAVAGAVGTANGNFAQLGEAVLDGCRRSVELTVSLLGMMCLWCGVLEVLKRAGVLDALSRCLAPVLRRIFPESGGEREVLRDIAGSVAANMLGVSSAATPYALSAMEKLDRRNAFSERASDDMVTLSLLGCSSVSLFPTTVITLLHGAGCRNAYGIILPVWLCSAVCTAFSLLLARLTRQKRSSS